MSSEICIHEVEIGGQWVVWQTVSRGPDQAWSFQMIEQMKPRTRFRIVSGPHSIHCAGYRGGEVGFDDSKCNCGAAK